jgi:hypothetical protein
MQNTTQNATLPPAANTCNVQLVNVYINSKQELCATLTDGYIAVQCEDVLYLDFVDADAMFATYMEWRQLALLREDGYTFVAA